VNRNIKKTALILGIAGQDGSFLARFLLSKNYSVFGTTRKKISLDQPNLRSLNIQKKVNLLSVELINYESVLELILKTSPDEIYCLAAQSSVSHSFQKPRATLESIIISTINVLEAVKKSNKEIKVYFAGSSECFGDTGIEPATENTPLNPCSPYGIAKSSAHLLTKNYKENYNIFACTGFLFNHESSLRPENFVTQKIIRSCVRISKGSQEKLELGNLSIIRDWGWAPEYVEAMWLMLQRPYPEDFIIATGQSNSLQSFVETSFNYFGLHWRDHILINKEFFRETDILVSRANPEKARKVLDWQPKKKIEDVIRGMIEHRMD
tara:strand:+ start:32 stop:1000 length:969 start_codon:yes stop_codon:yes gene_type:complete